MSPHEPKTGTKYAPADPRHNQPRNPPRFGLSVSQLVGSALAAASAAFGASYLGVAGTIIGAAVASVIATVASAMYASSLARTSEVVQSTVTQWTRTAATAPVVDPGAPEPADTATGARRTLPWPRIAVAAIAVLGVTVGALTGVEAVLGKPLASVVGGSEATGTTLGSVGGSPTRVRKTPRPGSGTTPPSSPAATPTGTPTGVPTPSPTTDAGDGATTPPVTPSPSPTAAPTGEPAPTPPG